MLYNCVKFNPQVDKFKMTRTRTKKIKESGVDFSIAAVFYCLENCIWLWVYA